MMLSGRTRKRKLSPGGQNLECASDGPNVESGAVVDRNQTVMTANASSVQVGSSRMTSDTRTRHKPFTTIDWRAELCQVLGEPLSTSDECILDKLEAAFDELKEARRLQYVVDESRCGPPRYQVIYRIRCGASTVESYEKPPWIVASGPHNAHLRGSGFISNLELYLERNKDIAFIVYVDFECCSNAPIGLGVRRREQYHGVDEDTLFLLTRESVVIVSKKMQDALQALPGHALRNIPHPTSAASSSTTMTFPYLWWFHSRQDINETITALRAESQLYLSLFQEYIHDRLRIEWSEVDKLITEQQITAEYLHYIYVPGQALISRPHNGRVAQLQGYQTTSWLNKPNRPDFGELSINATSWSFNGNFQQVQKRLVLTPPHPTSKFNISDLVFYPQKFASFEIVAGLLKRGKMYWKCRRRNYVFHQEIAGDGTQNSLDSRFMVDMETYKRMHLRETDREVVPDTDVIATIALELMEQDDPELGEDFFMCLPTHIVGFNMQRKEWVRLEVHYLKDVEWNTRAFDHLVINSATKELIKAVVMNQLGTQASTDVIRGTMAANANLPLHSVDDDCVSLAEKPADDVDITGESSQFSESSSPTANRKRVRTPTALDIWAESRQPNRHEPERNRHGQKIWYCKRCSYSQAAHNRVRGHLRDKHCVRISEQQTTKKLGQEIAIDRLFRQQAASQNGQDVERAKYLRTSVDEDAYNQALVNLITAHSLPHSLVEWPEWYALLHTVNYMAPRVVTQSRGQVPKLLEASFSTQRENLMSRLKASPTQIHFSIDIWSSPNHHSFLAIVAHFIDLGSRQLRKALLALRELEGAHSGDAIAEIFLQVVDSYGVRDKIGYFTLDNAYNNDTMMRAVAQNCDFNSAHRRLRCNGHIINLAVQAFLFGKNKDASDEAIRQVSQLSCREQEGVVGRAETATAWRQYGALGMLHNLVVWIRSSTQRYQAFLQAAGRMIPQDNSTRWNSWYRMIYVAITLRKELNSFMDDRYSESDIRLDYLHPEHWQELQEIHDFLQPFYEITKDTQWDKTSLDEVICSMDFLVTHYKAAMEQFRHNITMIDRIMTSWYKFDDYYSRTDDTPVYAAAILLHPSLREAHLKEAWKDQPQYISPAIQAVRRLWDDFKPQQEPEIEEDLSAYEAYKKRIYQKSSCHDEFSRFIEGPTLPIGASSALSWWLEPTQQTSYPSLHRLAINIFSIPAMSAEAERVFSGARRTVSWDRSRLSAQIVEYTECLKHWIKNGILDQPGMIPDSLGAELDTRDVKMLSGEA